jgi:hypothetical protein
MIPKVVVVRNGIGVDNIDLAAGVMTRQLISKEPYEPKPIQGA